MKTVPLFFTAHFFTILPADGFQKKDTAMEAIRKFTVSRNDAPKAQIRGYRFDPNKLILQ